MEKCNLCNKKATEKQNLLNAETGKRQDIYFCKSHYKQYSVNEVA